MITYFALSEGMNFVTFVLLGFVCVFLHELGHAMAAKACKIKTERIMLLPIGGIAQLERIPKNPWHELIIAIAGPTVNFVIFCICSIGVLFFQPELFKTIQGEEEQTKIFKDIVEQPYYVQLFFLNGILFAFNLIPAFPMDGGRIFRAILATFMNYLRATRIAARVGLGFAFLFFMLAWFSPNMFNTLTMSLLAFFIFLSATAEASMVRTRTLFEGRVASEAMITEFISASPSDPLWKLIDSMKKSLQADFPVVRDGKVFGVLPKNHIFLSYKKHGPGVLVGDIPFIEMDGVPEEEPLQRILEIFSSSRSPLIPVVKDDQIIGIITSGTLERFGAMVEATEQGSTGKYQH